MFVNNLNPRRWVVIYSNLFQLSICPAHVAAWTYFRWCVCVCVRVCKEKAQINLKAQALPSITHSFLRAIYTQKTIKEKQVYSSMCKAISLMSYPRTF